MSSSSFKQQDWGYCYFRHVRRRLRDALVGATIQNRFPVFLVAFHDLLTLVPVLTLGLEKPGNRNDDDDQGNDSQEKVQGEGCSHRSVYRMSPK